MVLWSGTNDNHGIPVGQFFTETTDSVNVNGHIEQKKAQGHLKYMNDSTFTGNINRVISKHNRPDKTYNSGSIVVTPALTTIMYSRMKIAIMARTRRKYRHSPTGNIVSPNDRPIF